MVCFNAEAATARKTVVGYPSAWANSFGPNFYTHAQARELAMFVENGTWQLSEKTQPFATTDLKVTKHEETQSAIRELIHDIGSKQEGRNDDEL